jgi:NADH-quinone oxidoreductase subunit G
VLLPVAPFTETAGAFVNAEGRLQGFHGVVRPLGETRPAWKVLRVLGNLLGLAGFEYASAEEVRGEALGDPATIAARLDNHAPLATATTTGAAAGALERLADIPIYCADALVRRAPSLQATADARPPVVGVPSALWRELGLKAGDRVRVSQGHASATLSAREDATLAANTVRVAAGHPSTANLGAMFGAIHIERSGA